MGILTNSKFEYFFELVRIPSCSFEPFVNNLLYSHTKKYSHQLDQKNTHFLSNIYKGDFSHITYFQFVLFLNHILYKFGFFINYVFLQLVRIEKNFFQVLNLFFKTFSKPKNFFFRFSPT